MVELRPLPLAVLARRMLREAAERGSVFDLPLEKAWRGAQGLDLSVRVHGRRAATPLGPAAGPHTQMAQNLVLSWLAGGRVLELKTVQVEDRLTIPRPCIDARTFGLNAEWSQELRLAESLEEYVKGAMLIELARERRLLPLGAGEDDTVLDLSVGYDLAGLRSEGVVRFLDGARDPAPLWRRLQAALPPDLSELRELAPPVHLATTLTLSTFHGCPPDEIEAMLLWLLEERGLDVSVKLNPMLLGPTRTRELLHEHLGYTDLEVPDEAFARDTTWEQAVGIVERVGERARALGRGFGIKLTNTLVVRNTGGFLASEPREVYLSGEPLHVLAIELVRRFRETFGDALPISFSAGVDRRNFPDAVALGLAPVTVCTDWLRTGGYRRGAGYLADLAARMRALGASDLVEWCAAWPDERTARSGEASRARDAEREGRPVAAAGDGPLTRNAALYHAEVLAEPRYRAAGLRRPPRTLERGLALFDCITCDKCVPVCPNDAIFDYRFGPAELPRERVEPPGDARGRPRVVRAGVLRITEPRQIGLLADLCNECGNCDVFCPEQGAPYRLKARVFARLEDFRRFTAYDGLHLARQGGAEDARAEARLVVLARQGGVEVALERRGAPGAGAVRYRGPGFDLAFDERDPAGTLDGRVEAAADLTLARVLLAVADGLLADPAGWLACGLVDAPQAAETFKTFASSTPTRPSGA